MQNLKKLDLTEVDIRPFSDRTIYNQFSCGISPIDAYLKNKAKVATRRHEMRVFCAHELASEKAIGYYALQLGSDSTEGLSSYAKLGYIGKHAAFPALHLAFLGIHVDYQRQKLGQYLLMDVFTKTAEIAQCAGFYALTLVSYDTASTAFYKSLNFEVYSEGLKQPKMLYPLVDLLDAVKDAGGITRPAASTPSTGG